jgi:hypothetical protein
MLKKIIRITLTLGASLIIGLLSFGGLYAIFPSIGLAFAAFSLSVAYEGEIYYRNIEGALNKLFEPNHSVQDILLKIFSVLSAVFMSLGTSYLLLEVFALLPFLSAISFTFLPVLIIPMALIAGLAYGLLTYNTISDLMTNQTVVTNFKNLWNDFRTNGLTLSNTLFAVASITLSCLAIGLTICTAGTWWTIVQQTRPLFAWMTRIPGALIAGSTAIINSLSALAFNLENSAESLQLLRTNPLQRVWQNIKEGVHHYLYEETLMQQLNPFRMLTLILFTPLRCALFLGHLISIGVTADRVPGMSRFTSACLGFVSEFFEDLHYFVPKQRNNEETHTARCDHDNDLPTRILRWLFTPLFKASQWWHGEPMIIGHTEITGADTLVINEFWEQATRQKFFERRQRRLDRANNLALVVYVPPTPSPLPVTLPQAYAANLLNDYWLRGSPAVRRLRHLDRATPVNPPVSPSGTDLANNPSTLALVVYVPPESNTMSFARG